MMNDITIGQYFPSDSFIHRLDPRFKIVLTLIYILMVFTSRNILCLAIGFVYIMIVVLLSKIPFIIFVKNAKPIIPFLVITAILNIYFVTGGDVYFHWKFIKITENGLNISIMMLIRIILIIIGSSLLTYTTSPITFTYSLEQLLSLLKKINIPVHEIVMMMSISLRFIPTLIEEIDKIISAQKARGAEFDSGSLCKRIKNMTSILIPLFISSFRRADELAMAMECRCYHSSSKKRTHLRKLKSNLRDYISLVVTLVFYSTTIIIEKLLK